MLSSLPLALGRRPEAREHLLLLYTIRNTPHSHQNVMCEQCWRCCPFSEHDPMRYIWLKSAISSDRRPADMRTLGYNQALPSNPGTQWVVVSAGIAQERVVMARSQMPDIDRMLQRPSGARMYE